MKLHDIQTTDPAACQDPIWELIPWYVNETLPRDEAEAVERHADGCDACAAEIKRQKKLAKEVATADPFEEPLAQSWQTLRTQIEADTRARKPQKQGWGGFSGIQRGFLALGSTIAVACLVLVVQLNQPAEEGFQTLTSASIDAGLVIKFQAAPEVTRADLNSLLGAHGATLTSGPTQQGIYTAALSEGKDVQATADALMAAPQILFAAPEADQ